jgi:hypothetical protein
MEKGKRLIFKLLIVFISVVCIDGGRSLSITGSKIQILLNHDQREAEGPHQHNLFSFNDDVKWVDTSKIDFLCLSQSPLKFLFNPESPSRDFADSIWQPPRSV